MKRPPRKPPTKLPLPPTTKGKSVQRQKRTFRIGPWNGDAQGEKIVLYGPSGVGKTTLASMLPNPVFIGLDDGGRKLTNPQTGAPLTYINGVETFQDVLDVLDQPDLFGKNCGTLVIDTFTMLEVLAEPYMFQTVKHEKGQIVTNIEGYGYGKGYTHLYDTVKQVLPRLDGLVRSGMNVCLICQSMAIKQANPAGLDYLYNGPKLSHPSSTKHSIRLYVCEWADHVLCVDYEAVQIVPDGPAASANVGKALGGGTQRFVFVQPRPHFFAKSRTLHIEAATFEDAADDSIWQYLFGETQ